MIILSSSKKMVYLVQIMAKNFLRELIEIDTTDSPPQQSLDALLLKSEPLITQGELALRQLSVADGSYEVVYENGVRRMVPKDE